ncbi:hypothetical protein Pcinc_005232 [Petrolisthes cinctipes]|uniref:Uncharacterized protein n=1 Tax=Petrolisthes cinctipes TaxID=88211 RepID=A0AAE1GFC5_PETCI|nr:hypothetical protein Pcinc_005232 [Petrolisthes cinctipes]
MQNPRVFVMPANPGTRRVGRPAACQLVKPACRHNHIKSGVRLPCRGGGRRCEVTGREGGSARPDGIFGGGKERTWSGGGIACLEDEVFVGEAGGHSWEGFLHKEGGNVTEGEESRKTFSPVTLI